MKYALDLIHFIEELHWKIVYLGTRDRPFEMTREPHASRVRSVLNVARSSTLSATIIGVDGVERTKMATSNGNSRASLVLFPIDTCYLFLSPQQFS
jgi:hypothetical protein